MAFTSSMMAAMAVLSCCDRNHPQPCPQRDDAHAAAPSRAAARHRMRLADTASRHLPCPPGRSTIRHTRLRNLCMPARPSSFHCSSLSGGAMNRCRRARRRAVARNHLLREMTLPFDLLITSPWASSTMPWHSRVLERLVEVQHPAVAQHLREETAVTAGAG